MNPEPIERDEAIAVLGGSDWPDPLKSVRWTDDRGPVRTPVPRVTERDGGRTLKRVRWAFALLTAAIITAGAIYVVQTNRASSTPTSSACS